MGITTSYAGFIIDAVASGMRLGRTLTLGHLTLYAPPAAIEHLLVSRRAWPPGLTNDVFLNRLSRSPYVDEFLQILGAESVDSMDASSYEDATIIHDLDEPVPKHLHEQFDCVLDGGTLEHVFNFTSALRSSMQMTRVGGHLILSLPANNCFGHGFYQFSPELVYRALSVQNGFEIVCMEAVETSLVQGFALGVPIREELAGPRYRMPDPADTGGRMELYSRDPTVLMVVAKRRSVVPIFATTPKQSDYVTLWKATDDTAGRVRETHSPNAMVSAGSALRSALKRMLPLELRQACVAPFRRLLARRIRVRQQRSQALSRKCAKRRM
jgi:hypothetical protein